MSDSCYVSFWFSMIVFNKYIQFRQDNHENKLACFFLQYTMISSAQWLDALTLVSLFKNQTIALGKILRYVKAIANIIYKVICCQQWLAVFFVDVLPRQTEKYLNCFGILLLMYLTPEFRRLGYNKNKLYKTLDCWSRDMLNFNFPEKGLELVCPTHFVYGSSRKMLLSCTLLTDQVLLSDCLYFLRYWTICVLELFFVNHVVTS